DSATRGVEGTFLPASAPGAENGIDMIGDLIAGELTVLHLGEQAIVVGVDVADVRSHGQANGIRIERSGGGGATNAATRSSAGVRGDLGGFVNWTSGEMGMNRAGEAGDEGVVVFGASEG